MMAASKKKRLRIIKVKMKVAKLFAMSLTSTECIYWKIKRVNSFNNPIPGLGYDLIQYFPSVKMLR
jgi:hypothetical protein